MKIKFFKKEKNFKKEKESLWLNVDFYWRLSIGFMFLILLLSFFFGYYFFIKINKESVSETAKASPQAEKIKKERIDKVLLYFSLREEKSAEIQNSPAPVVDPSL